MFNSVSEIIIGKSQSNYIENPMKNKVSSETQIDYTFNIMIDAVEKVSEIIAQPYDYIKHKIQNNEIESTDEKYNPEEKIEDISDNYVIILNPVNNEEGVDFKYENIYKNNEESADSSIDTVIKSANFVYTYMVSNYNDATT